MSFSKTTPLIGQETLEARFNSYLNHFPGVFFEQNPDFSLNFVSPYLEKLLGIPSTSILYNANAFLNLIHEEDREVFLKALSNFSADNKPFELHYRICHPYTGSVIYLLDIRSARLSPHGDFLGYRGVLVDKTRQVIAENHLTQSAWKESLSILVCGLVHDFSNIMAGIFSLSELYHTHMDKNNPMYEGMAQIKNNALEAQKLVRRILDLNRRGLDKKEYHNIEHLIQEQVDLLRIILPKHTTLSTHFTEQELPVYLDAVGLRQVLLNLGMNARDALGTKGKVSIQTKAIQTGDIIFEETLEGPYRAPKPGVEISFSDNGSGISQEHLSKIFSSHFSTKEASKGSGFGLYNAQLFMENHQGEIRAKSDPGKGTTFLIYLPLADFNLDTEDLTTSNLSAYENKPRPHCLVYSSQDPSTFEIVTLLQEQSWEVISFSRLTAVEAYLKETPCAPNILFAIDLGQDHAIASVLTAFREHYPNSIICLRVLGRNPDELLPSLKKKVDRIFDESIMDAEIVHQLTRCLHL